MSGSTRHGFFRVGAGCPRAHIADPARNVAEILDLVSEARGKGVQLLVTPELGITSYTAADLFFQQSLLLHAAEEALETLRSKTARLDMTIAVGLPLARDSRLWNAAAILQKGVIRGLILKSYIPNYKEFYEGRWFSPAREAVRPEFEILGTRVPAGADLVFRLPGEDSLAFGFEICEDLWVPSPPSVALAQAGATVLANLSASNEGIGKADYRRELVKQHSGRTLSVYLFSNVGVHESTTDLVFGGHQMVAENGVLLAENRRFRREADLVVTDVDVERISVERLRQKTFGENGGNSRSTRTVMLEPIMPPRSTHLLRSVDPHPFVPNDEGNLAARCAEIFEIQTTGLARRWEHTGSQKLILGLSGGLDSSLALIVAARTCGLLGRSRKTILAVTMPGFGTSRVTRSLALRLAEAAGVSVLKIDIRAACERHLKDIGLSTRDRSIAFENAQARERTQVLMDLANKENGLVVGTGDLSELALGFATFGGDHLSMYNVNGSVPKTLVRFLVRAASQDPLHAAEKKALQEVLQLPISPELLPPGSRGEISQMTEDIVGPYELHDFFLHAFLRMGASPPKMLFLAKAAFAGTYNGRQVKKWLRVFLERFFAAQFKRSTLPDGPKVGSVSLSPRGDFRMPSDAKPDAWLKQF
ncbi:MAG: NAD(+) synthase [Vicinamibacteria bacterium]|nr:NAD(+) synthase [Vicinamibacteria bacterium]